MGRERRWKTDDRTRTWTTGDDSEAHGRHRWAHRVSGAGSGQISSAASRKKSGRAGAGTASGDGAEQDAGRAAGAGSVQRAASKASGVTRGPWSVAGVGDFDGKAKLVILRNDLAIAHIVRDDVGGDFAVRQLLSILDDAGLQTIDALKIDVEGFERAALEPFFRAAPRSRWPKRICMEHLHDSDVMAGILRGCGYRLVKNTRNNALLILE